MELELLDEIEILVFLVLEEVLADDFPELFLDARELFHDPLRFPFFELGGLGLLALLSILF